jgi:glycosyltransferase involved in cell wall biosynthesis
VWRGALPRHLPWLAAPDEPATLPVEDEVRFLYWRFGSFWTRWALARAVLSGRLEVGEALRAWALATRERRPPEPSPLREALAGQGRRGSVSVVIPTLNRYPYLRVLLGQLERQTTPPCEVLVADQTPAARRERLQFPNLPLRVLYQEAPGQCSSRNAALEAVGGDYILFLDDDVEVAANLIEVHLATLERFGACASCGVAIENGAGPLPEAFTYPRASDVFPTNNSLVRRSALTRSGLFDQAYERGSRADGDLGMRLYRSGALLVLNPAIAVLHHHAPQGGLRAHRARVVTYASSRRRLLDRHLPSATEIYLARRYFTTRQVREMLWLRALGTLAGRGGKARRLAKAAVGLACLPLSGVQIARQYQRATRLLQHYPQIPELRC